MYTFHKKINFYDCDPAGILFYARVYEICHAAYEAMIESFNTGEDYWDSEEFIVPVINSGASYHKPIKYGEEVIINITVTQLKSTSFELTYDIRNGKGEKCVVVNTVHVFVSKKNWKKMNIIDKVKEGLEKHDH
jgi:YbgC/YbaW family acyl-CoA thioester hydrolase